MAHKKRCMLINMYFFVTEGKTNLNTKYRNEKKNDKNE